MPLTTPLLSVAVSAVKVLTAQFLPYAMYAAVNCFVQRTGSVVSYQTSLLLLLLWMGLLFNRHCTML
jgi:hypothetical protein